MAATTSRGSLRTSTIPADSMATSVPAPIAIPTSAVASAGASFHTVTNHCDPLATPLIAPHCGCFVGGENLGCDFIDSDASGHRVGNRFGISRDHRHWNTKSMKSPDNFIGFGSNFIFNGESAEDFSFTIRIGGIVVIAQS